MNPLLSERIAVIRSAVPPQAHHIIDWATGRLESGTSINVLATALNGVTDTGVFYANSGPFRMAVLGLLSALNEAR